MKILTAAAVLVAAVALSAPAGAACGNASIIGTTGGPGQVSWIMTEAFQNDPNFLYYYGTPSVYGSPVPAVSSNASISFWRQGSGDVVAGLGDDNGSYDMIAAGGFYAYALPSLAFYQAGQIAGGWSNPSVDGCIGGLSCQCVLITDQNGDEGFYAITGAMSATTNDTFLNQGGTDGNGNEMPIVLRPVPRPTITGSTRLGNFDIDLDVNVAGDGGANYVKDGCACGPVGFKVLQSVVTRGGMPPSNRDLSAWVEPTDSMGGAQDVTPLGGTASIRSACGSSDTDVYLTTQMFFDSGFSNSVVSGNSTRVECGPNLADPNGTKPVRPNRPRNDRPTNPRRR